MGEKKKSKWHQAKPGEWVYLRIRGHKIECCDCGLIHKTDFLVMDKKGRILNNVQLALRAYRKKK